MVCLSIFGYSVLKDQYMFPKMLFGKGDYALVFLKHPYPDHAPNLQEYYQAAITYHLASFLIHIFGKRNSDFIEMSLHHVVTMYLLLFSYMYNVWECGAVISFIHDFTDFIGHWTKVVAQLEHFDNVTYYSFAMVMVTWGWARNIVFPMCIYYLYTPGIFEEGDVTIRIYTYYLSCLVVLHYYWFNLFIRVISKAKYEGKYVDLQSKLHTVNEVDDGQTKKTN